MIALDAALRRLTVCQLTRESRGNGGGLRPRVWLRLRAAAGGNWTPDGILQLEGEANFSLSWGMKRTQKLLCMGLFSKKLNGPLLTGLWPRARRPSERIGCVGCDNSQIPSGFGPTVRVGVAPSLSGAHNNGLFCGVGGNYRCPRGNRVKTAVRFTRIYDARCRLAYCIRCRWW